MKYHQNRRTFFQNTTAGIAGLGAASALAVHPALSHGAGAAVKVAVVKNMKAISDRNVCDGKQARLMIDRALTALTGKQNAGEAWASLGVVKDDAVGIKVNCNSWTFRLFTHPELVYALCDSLAAVVPPNNIIIYERSSSEMASCGYRVNKGASGVRCFGNNEGGGFRSGEELTSIITDTCTKLINMPSLKTVEGEFGGSLFLKNHIGSIPDSHMSRCHGDADFCSQVCARPSIRNKTILGVCDGLRGTYKRGTPWYFGGIVVSRDQVAAECVALEMINEKRKIENLPALSVPRYVTNAGAKYGLGISDSKAISTEMITL